MLALMLLSIRQWDNKEQHGAEPVNTGARCKEQGIRQWAIGKANLFFRLFHNAPDESRYQPGGR